MIKQGQYLRKKDGQRISKNNKYPVVIVTDCRPNPDVEGGLIINSGIKILPEWFDIITKEEFDAERANPKYSKPHLTPAKEKKTIAIVGQYFRKKNWEFVGNWPAQRINSITDKNVNPGCVRINRMIFNIKDIVILTVEEFDAIMDEWAKLELSPVLEGKLETVHYREDTGEAKIGRSWDDAMRYVFTYNKRNPGKDMNAYQCPYCKQIHCGKVPKPETEAPLALKAFTVKEQEAIDLSKLIEKTMKKYWVKLDWQNMYDSNSRVNVLQCDIVATQRHYTGGWVQIFELIPFNTMTYDLTNELRESWHVEGKGMRSVYVPPKDIVDFVIKTIKAQGKKTILGFFKSLFTWITD